MLLKITENNLTVDLENFLRTVFAQLCKLCFARKVWDQLDPKFHCYLPQNEQTAQAADPTPSADEPELQLITDALLAK